MTLATGVRIARYEIVAPLGAGGMGEVYRARDPRLGREVAIKVLPQELSRDPKRLSRFEKEARAAAALNHPNILDVHDTGLHEGVPYIVSELLEGETLRERLSSAALPPRKAVDYAVQIAQGLAAAHEKEILHRDLKPENLFLTKAGRVKILDFGLAKLRGPHLPAESPLSQQETLPRTSEGVVLGTVGYMSPEQVRGDPVSARTDIFSFGVVLYEMLSRQRAFRGETAVETMNAILTEDPPALSSVKPSPPPALQRIVTRCLEKRPEERFHSAHDLGIALQSISGSAGEVSREEGGLSGAWLPWRKWKVALAAGVVAVLLALPLSLNLGGLRDRLSGVAGPGPIESLAVLPLENLSGDPEQEYFADGMTDALIADLAKIRALRVISRTSVMQYKGARKPLPQIASELNVDAVVEGSVMRSGDRVRITTQLVQTHPEQHLWADSYEQELQDILALQSEVARRIAEAVRATVTPEEEARLAGPATVVPEAHDAYLKGLYFWSQDSYEKAADYFKRALEADPVFAAAFAKLAECHVIDAVMGPISSEAFAKAEVAARRALELDDTVAEAQVALAEISAHRDWDWAAAERRFSRALRLNPNYATARLRHAAHLVAMGRFDEAIAESKHALALDPLSPLSRMQLAVNLHRVRRFDESIDETKEVLELDPESAGAHWVLGMGYSLAGMHDEAIAALQRADTLSPGDPNLRADLGRAYAVAGRGGQARQLLEELRSAPEPRRASGLQMAAFLAALGEKDEALDLLEGAFEERGGSVVWINVEPKLDPLRDDPRFQALVRRLNFPSS